MLSGNNVILFWNKFVIVDYIKILSVTKYYCYRTQFLLYSISYLSFIEFVAFLLLNKYCWTLLILLMFFVFQALGSRQDAICLIRQEWLLKWPFGHAVTNLRIALLNLWSKTTLMGPKAPNIFFVKLLSVWYINLRHDVRSGQATSFPFQGGDKVLGPDRSLKIEPPSNAS